MADYERQVAAQLGIAELLLTMREFGTGGWPKPRQVLGIGIVFAGLSIVQVASEPWQRLASTMGWLIVLGIGASAFAKGNPLGALGQLAASDKPLFPQQTAKQAAHVTGQSGTVVA